MCCITSDVLPSKTETTMWQALKWQDHTCLTIFLCSRHTPNKTLQSNNNNACLTLLILKALHECFLLNATCRVFAKSLKDKVGRKGHNSFAAKPHPCRASKENKTDTSSETVSSEDPLAYSRHCQAKTQPAPRHTVKPEKDSHRVKMYLHGCILSNHLL